MVSSPAVEITRRLVPQIWICKLCGGVFSFWEKIGGSLRTQLEHRVIPDSSAFGPLTARDEKMDIFQGVTESIP